MANATGSCIEVTYDTSLYNGYTISSWPSGTKILGGSGAVQSDYSAMIYTGWIDHAEFEDGTPLPRLQYRTGFYEFGQEGIYTIRYYTNGQDETYGIPLLPEFSFHDCGRVSSVKIIHSGDSTKDIQAIGGKAFAKTSLACITLPEGIRDIDTYAFSEVDTLSCITFPASLANPVSQYYPSIAGWVLESATSLNKIFAKSMTAPPIGTNTFAAIPSGGTLYYPVGSDYSTWLDALPQNWTWATYDPYAVDTCDCAHDGENVPIIESGTTNPPSGTPYIFLSGYSNNYLAATGSCVSLPIIATNCTYSSFTATIDYNPNLTAHSVASVTEENGSLKLCLTSNPLTGDAQVAIITVILYDTNGNSYLHYLGLNQYGNPNPEPPIPSGETVDSGSTSHTITYSGCPLVFDHSASTGTWNTLPTVTTGGTTNDWWITYDVPANDTDSARTITYYYLQYSGQSCSDLVDTVSYTISQAAGSGTPTPSSNIWLTNTEQTISANTSIPNNNYIWVGVKTSGCNMDSGAQTDITYTVSGASIVSGITQLNYVQTVNYNFQLYWNRNTSTSQREAYVTFTFKDTSGNTYNDTLHITQLGAKQISISPMYMYFSAASSSSTAEFVAENTTIQSIQLYSSAASGTWEIEPTATINGTQLLVSVPENTGGFRSVTYYYVITDADGEQYIRNFYLYQYPAPQRWVYLNPSGRTHNAYTDGSSNFYIMGSGCSIDSAYTPTFTFSGDTTWIDSIERINYTKLRSGWTVYYPVSRNLGQSDREIYIIANGVHDTDGNVYNDLVYHATQNWSAYTFLNYDKGNGYVSSARTTQTAEVVGVNTNICSVEIYSAWSQTPQYWEGVEQPTVSLLGNYLTVVWPENPYSNNRNYAVQLMVSWGENCRNSIVLGYGMSQYRAGTPTQKDIKAADADYSVGSGTGNASTTIQTSGCTYDHFTYITGGSFSVTATSGPDNTIVFTYPENPTNSARTGYVYITFYDSDGNSYGPQTITFTQQAGSSPGPGPGPDPSTGYVLTTLTISDQEQHRYFVEARPGVVYSAAGQYYKTILACEARYSLYYVNSYGGVDVLPFKEKGWKKSDTITRFNYSRSFRNNTPEFENVNYMNEIKASWELHTGWLSDEQSKRMHELIESTIVYLYDAEEKTYTPVVMTDKKLEYKTYHNQGKKFYNYTVNVEESQSKERR